MRAAAAILVFLVASCSLHGISQGSSWLTQRGWQQELERRAFSAGISEEKAVNTRPLLGVKYVVAVKDSPPFIIPVVNGNGNDTFMGYAIDFLEYLSSSLGFEYSLVVSPNNTGESVVNMVSMQIEGANLSIGSITLTAERTKKVLFTTPFFDLGLRIVHFPMSSPPSIWQFLVPFHYRLWVGTGLMFLVFMISIVIFEGNINDKDFQSHRPLHNLFLGMYYTFQTMVQQTAIRAESREGRILLTSAMFLFFVLAATYTAQLTSFLTLTKYTNAIYDVNSDGTVTQEDLSSFRSRLAIAEGSSIETWFIQQVSGGSRDFIPCGSYRDCLDMVARGEADGTIYDGPIAEYTIKTEKEFSGLRLLGEAMNPQGYGVALRHGDPYVEYFNSAILEARSNGLSESLRKIWIPRVLRSDDSDNMLSPMNPKEVGGVFIIAVASICLAWFVFLLKILRKRYGSRLGVPGTERRSTDDIEQLPKETRIVAMQEMLATLKETGRLPNETVRERLLMKMVLDHTIRADRGITPFPTETIQEAHGYKVPNDVPQKSYTINPRDDAFRSTR